MPIKEELDVLDNVVRQACDEIANLVSDILRNHIEHCHRSDTLADLARAQQKASILASEIQKTLIGVCLQ